MRLRTTTYRICVRTGERKPPQQHRVINTTADRLLQVLSKEQVKELIENGRLWNEVNMPNVLHYFELYEIIEEQ